MGGRCVGALSPPGHPAGREQVQVVGQWCMLHTVWGTVYSNFIVHGILRMAIYNEHDLTREKINTFEMYVCMYVYIYM